MLFSSSNHHSFKSQINKLRLSSPSTPTIRKAFRFRLWSVSTNKKVEQVLCTLFMNLFCVYLIVIQNLVKCILINVRNIRHLESGNNDLYRFSFNIRKYFWSNKFANTFYYIWSLQRIEVTLLKQVLSNFFHLKKNFHL